MVLFGVCNVVGSSISRETHAGAHAGPEIGCFYQSFTTQITVLTNDCFEFSKAKGTLSHSDFTHI
jgi:glucosamine--fructose-6-phosphate aminotransferase (isomerizing)